MMNLGLKLPNFMNKTQDMYDIPFGFLELNCPMNFCCEGKDVS